jgi:hypothetical protein
MIGYGYCSRCAVPLAGSRRASCGTCDPGNRVSAAVIDLSYGSRRARPARIDPLCLGALAGLIALVVLGTYNSGPGSAALSPSSVSCSSSQRVSTAVTLQAPVDPDEQLQVELDGTPFGVITVSQYFQRLPNGAWSNATSDTPLTGCNGPDGQLTMGAHEYRLLDSQRNVLAAVAFTVTP